MPPYSRSNVMKSGVVPFSIISLQMLKNSSGLPMQCLKPMGFPSESSRKVLMNSINSSGVLKAVCAGGEITSFPISTPRTLVISSLTLAAGRMPPWAGFAPWESLISIALTFSNVAFSLNAMGSKFPSLSWHPK